MTTILLPLLNHVSELQGVPFFDIRGQLPVNPNYTWAQLAGVRDAAALNTTVCHHDGIPKAKSAKYSDIELAKRIATDHINSKKNHAKGDAGFPYDVWIRNGNLYWANDIEQREYGVAGNNGYTVNVCVSGDYYNGDVLSPEDRKALYAAVLMIKQALPAMKSLKGHGEIQPTNCPGYDVIQVRRDIIRIEMEIERANAPVKQEELAFRMANQVLYYYNMFNKGLDSQGNPVSDGQRKWALKQMMLLEPEMKKHGMLN